MAWFGSKNYTVQAGMVTGTLTDFPTLLAVKDPDFRAVAYGGQIQTGFDIAFFADAAGAPGAMLDFERVHFDNGTGEVVAWLKVPSIAVGTKVHVQYGDATVVASLDNKTGVWAGYRLVDHLEGGVLAPSDSSPTPTTGVAVGVVAGAGKVRGGAYFSENANQAISYGSPAKLETTTIFTYSCWVKMERLPVDPYTGIMIKTRATAGQLCYQNLYVKSNGKLACYVITNATSGAATNYDGTGANTLATLVWYYLSMSFNTAFGIRGYVNGVADGTAAGTAVSTSTVGAPFVVGHDVPYAPRRFPGWIDEIRISPVERTVDWERACYLNQVNPSAFWGLTAPSVIFTGREQFKNSQPTTLVEAADKFVTTVKVASSAGFPATPPFRVKSGSEVMLARTKTGNVLSDLIRGAEGTVPAAHAAGDAISHGITAMGLRGIPFDRSAYGDKYKVPHDSAFFQYNSPLGVVSDDAGIVLTAPARGSGYWLVGLYQTAPPPPYSVTASFQFVGPHKQFVGFGMMWVEAGGKVATFDCLGINGEVVELSARKAANGNTFNSSYQLLRVERWPRWLRLSDDGVNRKCWFSADGQYWIEFYSIPRLDWLTIGPGSIGVQIYSENTASPTFGCILRVLSWDVVVG